MPVLPKVARSRGQICRSGAWLSLVERLLWEQDVGGSNPLAPTMARIRPKKAGVWTTTEGNGLMALARIYRPSKTAMQAGRRQTRKWILEFEPASRRDPDPLMGWSSAQDTLNEVQLRFDTLDEAVAFADKHRLQYSIIEPHQRSPKAKSYADNFRYDRIRI